MEYLLRAFPYILLQNMTSNTDSKSRINRPHYDYCTCMLEYSTISVQTNCRILRSQFTLISEYTTMPI